MSRCNRNIIDKMSIFEFDGKITDTIRPKVLPPVLYNGDIAVLYYVTFFGGHSVLSFYYLFDMTSGTFCNI